MRLVGIKISLPHCEEIAASNAGKITNKSPDQGIIGDLKDRGFAILDEIYYYLTQDRYEIDFFTRSLDGKTHLYQVVWDVRDKQTLEREMRALKQAEQELGITGELISPDSYFNWLEHS